MLENIQPLIFKDLRHTNPIPLNQISSGISREALNLGYGGFIEGEWLLWHFYLGGSDYATRYLPQPCLEKSSSPSHYPSQAKQLSCPKSFKESCDSRFGNGKNASVSADWTSGFRVGAGYIFAHDNWDLYASYTQIISDARNTVKGPLFPLLFFQNLEIRCPCIQQCPVYCVDRAESAWELEFRTADLDLGREYFVGGWLSVHPTFGVKGAWIDQTLDVRYVWFLRDCLIEKCAVAAKNDFSGVGPKIGASSNWFMGKGFSLYAGLFGALLWGDFSLKQEQAHKECLTMQVKSCFNRLVPTARGRVGLLWDGFFNKNRNHLGVSIGWEMQYWWRQNQIERFTDGFLPIYVRSSEDLGMQGLTAGLRFDF